MTSSLSPTCNSHSPFFLRTSGTTHWFPSCLILSSHVFLGYFCFLVAKEEKWKNEWTGSSQRAAETPKVILWVNSFECIHMDGLWICQQAQAELTSICLNSMCIFPATLHTVAVSCEGCSLTFCSTPWCPLLFLFCVSLAVSGSERRVTQCTETSLAPSCFDSGCWPSLLPCLYWRLDVTNYINSKWN